MLSVKHLAVAVFCVTQGRASSGENIMLNKPAVQSSTHSEHVAGNANDGSGVPSGTVNQQDPYWQGDLQGFYNVTSISVTSAAVSYGDWVAVTDVNCPEDEVTRCGQWPDEYLPGHTIVFECPSTGPVRFVRTWKLGKGFINLAEVEVEGQPSKLTGIAYDKVTLQKITTPATSLSVDSVTDCSAMCHRMQPCFAFSFTEIGQPNCLLATNTTMSSEEKWASYNVSPCIKVSACSSSA